MQSGTSLSELQYIQYLRFHDIENIPNEINGTTVRVQEGTKPIRECDDSQRETDFRESNKALLGRSTICIGAECLNGDENEGIEDADSCSSGKRTMPGSSHFIHSLAKNLAEYGHRTDIEKQR